MEELSEFLLRPGASAVSILLYKAQSATCKKAILCSGTLLWLGFQRVVHHVLQAEGGEYGLSQEEGVLLRNVLQVVNHLARDLGADLRTDKAQGSAQALGSQMLQGRASDPESHAGLCSRLCTTLPEGTHHDRCNAFRDGPDEYGRSWACCAQHRAAGRSLSCSFTELFEGGVLPP